MAAKQKEEEEAALLATQLENEQALAAAQLQELNEPVNVSFVERYPRFVPPSRLKCSRDLFIDCSLTVPGGIGKQERVDGDGISEAGGRHYEDKKWSNSAAEVFVDRRS